MKIKIKNLATIKLKKLKKRYFDFIKRKNYRYNNFKNNSYEIKLNIIKNFPNNVEFHFK